MVHDTIQSLNCVVEFIYIYTILIVQSDLPFCSSDFFSKILLPFLDPKNLVDIEGIFMYTLTY